MWPLALVCSASHDGESSNPSVSSVRPSPGLRMTLRPRESKSEALVDKWPIVVPHKTIMLPPFHLISFTRGKKSRRPHAFCDTFFKGFALRFKEIIFAEVLVVNVLYFYLIARYTLNDWLDAYAFSPALPTLIAPPNFPNGRPSSIHFLSGVSTPVKLK